MRHNISFWSKFEDTGTRIYIVPRHADNPPLPHLKEGWVPVTMNYEDRPFERFVEDCRIHGYTFLDETEIEKVTGIRKLREFGRNVYVINKVDQKNSFWNSRAGWIQDRNNASRYFSRELADEVLPPQGQWQQLC